MKDVILIPQNATVELQDKRIALIVDNENKVKFVPLNDEKKVWANIVIAAARDKTNREMPELRNSIFNIEKSATLLTDYYKQLLSRV